MNALASGCLQCNPERLPPFLVCTGDTISKSCAGWWQFSQYWRIYEMASVLLPFFPCKADESDLDLLVRSEAGVHAPKLPQNAQKDAANSFCGPLSFSTRCKEEPRIAVCNS